MDKPKEKGVAFWLTKEQVAVLAPVIERVGKIPGAVLGQIIIGNDSTAICRARWVPNKVAIKIQKLTGIPEGDTFSGVDLEDLMEI